VSNTPVQGTEPIPERPALPLIGHVLDVPDGADGLLYAMKEARELGPLFRSPAPKRC
jgi:cytochrome P450/NADPH-cytochrome P450 reductase